MDQNYEEKVKELAEKKINELLPNSTLEHASIGIKYLIKNAESKIKIVSNEFFEEFWAEMQPFLSNFLDKETSSLDVVILEEYKKEGILTKLKDAFPERVKIYSFKNKDIKSKISNFVTVDQMGYRIELSDEQKKDKVVKGIINFGDKSGTDSLNNLFQTIIDKSQLEA